MKDVERIDELALRLEACRGELGAIVDELRGLVDFVDHTTLLIMLRFVDETLATTGFVRFATTDVEEHACGGQRPESQMSGVDNCDF